MKSRVEAANEVALTRLISADPVLVDVAPAREVVDGLEGRMILHAGPPIAWQRMCGAMRGSVIGLVLWEGWAGSAEEAERLIAEGGVRLEPNHHHHGVGPMAGTTSPSLPVWVVENRTFGNRAFCRLAESYQQFGQFDAEALGGLTRWRDVWAPSIRAGLRRRGPISLKSIIARALVMGDELHNRPNAASSLFANVIGQAMVDADVAKPALLETMGYLAGNEFLFLGISMAAAKSAAEPVEGVADGTLVTAMARNGVEFGIRVAGMPGEWFVAPAPQVEGLMLPGFKPEDAGLDMGDSAITETVGWGGFVLGGAPGILALTGGTPEQALQISRDMRQITAGASPDYRMPALGFAGAAVGIDVRKVVATGIEPLIDTAIAHRDPGHPKIGGGLVRAPMACFRSALAEFGRRHGV
ncbi:MAG TPA: DUF1116 domain-containing protein [Candidatus Dormibacteraeota bacterium]|nr:DUF1116 domain-containing protein [Candidatus Dormibacteraeota bacterium]